MMRKEVKLGMGIGGGVVALLVVYLLVAPPGGGKKGVELVGAGGNANGSLVDPALPADPISSFSANVEQPTVNGNALVDANLKKDQAQPTRAQDKSAGGTSGAATAQKDTAKGAWTSGTDKGQPLTSTSQPPTRANEDAGAKASPKVEQSATVVADAGGSRGQTHLYFDPKGAWGGGVSTDAGSPQVGRAAPKGNLSPAPRGDRDIGPNSHVVRTGETFSSIAQVAYGSAAYYPHILRANPGLNPKNLKPGIVINLPPASEVKASAAAEKSGEAPAGPKIVDDVKIDSTRQYKVVSGDSLYKIGQKLYGTGVMGDKIYQINRQVIGPDPTRLKLGMVLDLPTPPAAGGADRPAGTRTTSGSLEEAWNAPSSNEPFFGNESDPK